MDEQEFWDKVEEIAKDVDTWPEWKREGWAALDRCPRDRIFIDVAEYER